jgi:hypothetical protein
MGRKKENKQGICCICGSEGELTFEHVPPKSAYNKDTVIKYKLDNMTDITTLEKKGRKLQGGIGSYTLCPKCNNDTGAWYGGEYVKWARNSYDIIWQLRKNKQSFCRVLLYDVYPLRFLKQVITCHLSNSNVPNFSTYMPDLADFISNKSCTDLPSDIRVFLSLYSASDTTNLRRWSNVSRRTIIQGEQGLIIGESIIFDEITHPPFQLVMTEENQNYPHSTEITNFSKYRYDESDNLTIDLRMLSSSSPYPGQG